MDDYAFPSIKKFACTLTLLVCKPNTEVCRTLDYKVLLTSLLVPGSSSIP